ncbi:hypothetical protein B0H14DRAFT_3861568 [Mycena olivaceomarginata]|nr:hypothetical protein B0H14DRAFT_3861568 [Mycena olivaceomarginata]
MASNFLRVRLSPPLIDPTTAVSRTTTKRNFTPISLNQAVLAETLDDLAKTWSRAPTMSEQLVEAVARDLDTQLANVPALGHDLRQLVDDSQQREWSRDIDTQKQGVLEEVKMRASVLGKVDIKVTDKAPVQDCITAILVGYRTGTSLLWSDPIYNRRNDGNEFEQPSTPDAAQTMMDALLLVFGGVTAGPTEQTGIPLLFLAVALKGAMKYAPWLQQSFPSLSGLQFTAADRDPILKQQASQYTGTGMKKEDIEKASKRSGDKSGDYKPTKGAHALAPNTLWSGPRSFAGRWYGELADPAGYSVTIVQPLSHGSHGVVYAGQLWQAGFSVSEVAIEVSDDAETLRAELARYEELKDVMGHHIPRCYGVFVVDNGAFLVTELLESRDTVQSQHERAAIYEALSKLHETGWMHNDIVAAGSALRNLLWARSGHAVLIDLVTVSRHNCHGTCDELEGARNVLQLPEPRIIVKATDRAMQLPSL